MDYPIKKGTVNKAKMDNAISPTGSGKKKQPAMNKGMFGESALGSEIAATKSYASKTKASVNKALLKSAENSISPDSKCC